MGCDIHMVLERKHGLKWIAVDTFKSHEASYSKGYTSPSATSRNYARFAALANVRGDGPEPRGIPADISDTTAMLLEDWEGDAHSMSWLPLGEAAKIFIATEYSSKPEDFAAKYPQSHFFGVDESDDRNKRVKYRLIFWFDN
jgi:hypothetical protein